MKKVFITCEEYDDFHRIVTLYTLEEIINYLDEDISKNEFIQSLEYSIEEDDKVKDIMKLDIMLYDEEGNPTTIDKIRYVDYKNFTYLYNDEYEEVTEENINKLKLMSDLDVIELTTHSFNDYYNFGYDEYVKELKRLVDVGKQAQELLNKYDVE